RASGGRGPGRGSRSGPYCASPWCPPLRVALRVPRSRGTLRCTRDFLERNPRRVPLDPSREETPAVKAANAVAKILKKEGVEFLIGYPVNQIIEAAAEEDIRTIIVRQERVGRRMADAVSRVSSGPRIGVFAMQHGPGTGHAFGGVAQAFGDSVPIVVLP